MSRNYTTNRNNPFISEFLTNEAYPVCPYFSTSRNIAGFYGICAYLIISNIAIIVLVVFLSDRPLRKLYKKDVRNGVLLVKNPKDKFKA